MTVWGQMKNGCCLMLLAALWVVACTVNQNAKVTAPPPAATPRSPLPHSMKGYELYSWQVDGEWYFTLITGTNRLKSPEEITSGADTVSADGWVRISVQGVDALKSLLGRLPEHEDIMWIGDLWLERAQVEAGNLTLPPLETTDAIEAHCQQLGLELRVSR